MVSNLRPLLLLISMLLTGCAGLALPGQAPPADALAHFRLAMAPDQRALIDQLPSLPIYRIAVRIDPADLSVIGEMELTLPPVAEAAPPADLYFRLYPNLAHYGGQMGIDLVTVNDQGAPFSYAASDTAVHVAVPPTAVTPDQPIVVGFRWRLQARQWPAERYSLFGDSQGVISLPLFYPLLAVRQRSDPAQWHLELGNIQGDAAFSETALYDVTATVPEGYTVVSTGSALAVTDHQTQQAGQAVVEPGWKDWRLVSGPAREFALFLSNQLRLAETTAYGVQLNSWYLPGDEVSGRAAAEYAAAALRIYQDLYGPYPYREIDILAGPLTFRGMEYPGLFELGSDLYRSHADELEFRVAHEMAHQWWYNIVGNDPVNTPWLDEGLAEYSTYYYLQKTRGQAAADRLVATRWEAAYDYVRSKGLDAAVNQPVDAFQPNNYETLVYGKAALFFHALAEAIGEESFQTLVRRYSEQFRFGVATPEEFMSLAEEMAGATARDLYRQWILQVDAAGATEPVE
jgi:hypothetical protein